MPPKRTDRLRYTEERFLAVAGRVEVRWLRRRKQYSRPLTGAAAVLKRSVENILQRNLKIVEQAAFEFGNQ